MEWADTIKAILLCLTAIIIVTGSLKVFGRGYIACLIQVTLGSVCLVICAAAHHVLGFTFDTRPFAELLLFSSPLSRTHVAFAAILSFIVAGLISAATEFVAVSVLGRPKGN